MSTSSEAFEYAIKKDVRNNPIVREVDRDRHREMWRSLGVGAFLVGVLLFSAWQHFELLQTIQSCSPAVRMNCAYELYIRKN